MYFDEVKNKERPDINDIWGNESKNGLIHIEKKLIFPLLYD